MVLIGAADLDLLDGGSHARVINDTGEGTGAKSAGDEDRAMRESAHHAGSLKERTEEFQRRAIEQAVQENGGNWAAAARTLGMHRSNLHHLAQRLGLRD